MTALIDGTPFLSVPFKFSDSTYKLLLEKTKQICADHEEKKLPDGNVSALTDNTEFQDHIHFGPIGEELKRIISNYALPRPTYQFFVYRPNSRYSGIGNPHIDSLDKNTPCPMRFNLLVEGDSSHKLYWWSIETKSGLIEETTFKRNGLPDGWRQQVRGENIRERLATLGEPHVIAAHTSVPQRTGVFVRTDLVHSVEIANSKRVVFSLRFNAPWSQLFK